MCKHRNLLIGTVAAAALFSSTAFAGTVTPALGGNVIVSEGSTVNSNWTFNDTYTDNGDGTFTYQGVNGNQTVWAFSWDITVNPDPIINATLGITNNTAATKHFDVTFTLPVGSPFALGTKSGSMSATYQDLNGSGLVSLSNVDWSGRIDGVDAMSLTTFDGTCGPGSPGCIGSLGTVSDGPLPSGAVNTNIGIHLAFDLTAGDKATFTTSFEVVPIPVPAAVWLFGSGLLGLGAFSRRRKN